MVKNNEHRAGFIAKAVLLSLVLLFDEILLKYSTIGGTDLSETAVIACNAVTFGTLLAAVTSLSSRPRLNRFLTLFVSAAASVLFLVNYFIYYQFKIFYDINTVANGTSGVLSGFRRQMIDLITGQDGILRIALYMIPVIITVLFNRFDKAERITLDSSAVLAAVMSVSMGISTVSQYTLPGFRSSVDHEYNFQTVIGKTGLLEGLLMDALHNGIDDQNIGFASDPVIQAKKFARPAEIVYEPNVLNIDFKALAASAEGTEQSMDEYVASVTPSLKNDYTGLFEGKNLIMIAAEAFTAEAIDKDRTPTLYRMAEKGIRFTDYYQPASAGTTGGEYEIIFGALPTSGGSSFKKMASRNNYMTIGSQLDRLGYNGWAFHNNSYTFYDRHITHNTIGYSHGYMGVGNGLEDYITSQWPESDLEMLEATVPMYIGSQPFNVYYMSVSGHNGYTRGENAMARKNWDTVQGDWTEPVHGYLAANVELENAMAYLVGELEKAGILDDTVIVIGADHFPYGLDYGAAMGNMPYLEELYGRPITDSMVLDHNRLIIWSGCLEDMDPITVDTPTSSLDILPTLSNLFGTKFDSRLFVGRDALSDAEALVFNMNYEWKTALGTYVNGAFTPKSLDTVIPDGYVDRIKKLVQNKMKYCQGIQSVDYFDHVFG